LLAVLNSVLFFIANFETNELIVAARTLTYLSDKEKRNRGNENTPERREKSPDKLGIG